MYSTCSTKNKSLLLYLPTGDIRSEAKVVLTCVRTDSDRNCPKSPWGQILLFYLSRECSRKEGKEAELCSHVLSSILFFYSNIHFPHPSIPFRHSTVIVYHSLSLLLTLSMEAVSELLDSIKSFGK